MKHLTLLITHYVFNVNKPTQERAAYDASATYQETSLNENLIPGLDFLDNLISVLTRFRQDKYAVMADIKQIYHQVKVPLVAIDALRFPYRDNPAEGLSEYAMLVHVFGKVDSPCCSNWTLRQFPLKTDISLENVINCNFYRGEFLKSLSAEEDIKKPCHIFDKCSCYLQL